MSVTCTVQVAQATVGGRIVEMKTTSVKPNVNQLDKHYKINALKENGLKI